MDDTKQKQIEALKILYQIKVLLKQVDAFLKEKKSWKKIKVKG